MRPDTKQQILQRLKQSMEPEIQAFLGQIDLRTPEGILQSPEDAMLAVIYYRDLLSGEHALEHLNALADDTAPLARLLQINRQEELDPLENLDSAVCIAGAQLRELSRMRAAGEKLPPPVYFDSARREIRPGMRIKNAMASVKTVYETPGRDMGICPHPGDYGPDDHVELGNQPLEELHHHANSESMLEDWTICMQ